MAHKAFHAPEAFRERHKFQRFEEGPDVVLLIKLERHHSAAVSSLGFVDLITLRGRKSRIIDVLYRLVFTEERRNLLRIPDMPVHAYREGLYASDEKKRIERTGYAAFCVLQEADALREVIVIHHCESRNQVAVPSQILGRRMNHDVSTEL